MSRLGDVWPDIRAAVFKRKPDLIDDFDALYSEPAGKTADWLDKHFPIPFGATWRGVMIKDTAAKIAALYPIVEYPTKAKAKPAFKRPATNVTQSEALAMIRRLTGRS